MQFREQSGFIFLALSSLAATQVYHQHRHVVLRTSTFNYTNSVLSHCNLLWGDNRKEIFTGQDRKTRKNDLHANAWTMYELDNCRGRTRDRLQEERAHLILSNGKRECVKRCRWQKHYGTDPARHNSSFYPKGYGVDIESLGTMEEKEKVGLHFQLNTNLPAATVTTSFRKRLDNSWQPVKCNCTHQGEDSNLKKLCIFTRCRDYPTKPKAYASI